MNMSKTKFKTNKEGVEEFWRLGGTTRFTYSSHRAQGKSIFHECEVNTQQTIVSVRTQRTLTRPY